LAAVITETIPAQSNVDPATRAKERRRPNFCPDAVNFMDLTPQLRCHLGGAVPGIWG